MQQLDLLTNTDGAFDLGERVARWHHLKRLDCCTGEYLGEPGAALDASPRRRERRRCGRCGVIHESVRHGPSHDRGWMGCPNLLDPSYGNVARTPYAGHALIGYQGFGGPMPREAMRARHDRRHVPDCGGCGLPWGLHRWSGGLSLPAYSPGQLLPRSCDGWSHPDPVAWYGWCPGCLDRPHGGACAPLPDGLPGAGVGRFAAAYAEWKSRGGEG